MESAHTFYCIHFYIDFGTFELSSDQEPWLLHRLDPRSGHTFAEIAFNFWYLSYASHIPEFGRSYFKKLITPSNVDKI